MATMTSSQSGGKLQGTKRRVTPKGSGTPDPRPWTTYSVTHSTLSGHSRITVTLDQPCVIRNPMWPCIDTADGSRVNPTSVTVLSNVSFQLDYTGIFATSVGFIYVPPQDMEVQNFRGGYASPGGQWFRKPF